MESDELLAQKNLRTEVIQLEDILAQGSKEDEMLKIKSGRYSFAELCLS